MFLGTPTVDPSGNEISTNLVNKPVTKDDVTLLESTSVEAAPTSPTGKNDVPTKVEAVPLAVVNDVPAKVESVPTSPTGKNNVPTKVEAVVAVPPPPSSDVPVTVEDSNAKEDVTTVYSTVVPVTVDSTNYDNVVPNSDPV